MNDSQNTSGRLFILLQISILICLFAVFSFGQSGRRTAPPVASPTPETTVTEKPKPVKKPEQKLDPLFKVKVFKNSNISNSQFLFPDRMSVWVTERLRNSPLLDVSSGSPASMNEVKKLAKDATDTHLIYVELAEDPFISPSASQSRTIVGDVYIRYTVFEPVTGKKKFGGQILLYSGASIGNPTIRDSRQICNQQISGKDLVLLYASIETAEKILANFKIPIPALKCGAPI